MSKKNRPEHRLEHGLKPGPEHGLEPELEVKSIFFIVLSFLSLLFISVLLASCSSGGPQNAQYNFKQGISELQVRVLPNAPPENIYPNSYFKIILELENQAAHDATDGRISLLGLDPRYFLVVPQDAVFDVLVGKSLTTPAGDKLPLEFSGTAGELFDNAREYNGNYFLKLNYNSKMDFAHTICINTNLYQVDDAGCSVTPSQSFSGQGAPLAVTSLEQITTPGVDGSMEFRLMLQNKGKGKVGSVTVSQTKLGPADLSCEFPEGTGSKKTAVFTQDRQQALLLCRLPIREQVSYTTTISLQFIYNYEVVLPQRLRLVNPTYARK